MIIVIDTNIIVSALITPNSRLARVLTHYSLAAKRISAYIVITELARHLEKIVKASKRSSESVTNDIYAYLQYIKIYEETIILPEYWLEADRLTKGVDSDDIVFVALALQTGGLLWTGDKKLADHLKAMGFDRVINTAELYELLNID
jgi:predicted nucleic acid-binding protein